jgi:hypothetical protein
MFSESLLFISKFRNLVFTICSILDVGVRTDAGGFEREASARVHVAMLSSFVVRACNGIKGTSDEICIRKGKKYDIDMGAHNRAKSLINYVLINYSVKMK